MQERKLVAVDMDGTFLNDKMDYDRALFGVIHEQMMAQGIRFVVASGNQYYQLRSFFEGYPDIVYVSENGALIRDDEQIYFDSVFSDTVVHQIIDVLRSYPAVKWAACGVKAAYVLKSAGDDYIAELRKYYYRLEVIDDPGEIDDEIVKFASSCPAAETAAYVAEYRRRLAGLAVPTSSGHGDIDIIQPGMHKARGLEELGTVLGVPAAAMTTFGNGGNDIEMLQYAGDGVAVANADDAVVAVADHVTLSNNDQGVLHYIKKHLL